MVTVVNPWHWLNQDGSFPPAPRTRARILRVAQCIEYGGPLSRGFARETLVPCQRRPKRKPCLGLLWVLKQSDDAILAFCNACHQDEYLIYEWEDTLWADGVMPPTDVRPATDEQDEAERQTRARDPDRLVELLERGLTLVGSDMRADAVVRLISASGTPSDVLQAILGNARCPPQAGAVERLLPVLIDLWNATPRPSAGGVTPTEVVAGAADRGVRPGRNHPCPCGSGAKYKRCCLARTVH